MPLTTRFFTVLYEKWISAAAAEKALATDKEPTFCLQDDHSGEELEPKEYLMLEARRWVVVGDESATDKSNRLTITVEGATTDTNTRQ